MRARLTYANVVSTLLLIAVVVGGTAAALPGKKSVQANDLRKNSVKARAIANKAVRGAEIKDGAVGGAEVADQALQYADFGSNAVVARIGLAAPVTTEGTSNGNPKEIPLSGATWTQPANETEVFFADAIFVEPATCTGGSLEVQVLVDGQELETEFLEGIDPGTVTRPAFSQRPYLFEPGADTPHTATMLIEDSCTGGGQDYTLQAFDITVIGMR